MATLGESEEKFKTIFNKTTDGILLADIESKELFLGNSSFQRKMIFLNEAGRRMIGIDPKQVEQTSILQVIPPHLQDLVKNELLPQLSRQGTWEEELQYVNLKTGRITDVHASTFSIKDPNTDTPAFRSTGLPVNGWAGGPATRILRRGKNWKNSCCSPMTSLPGRKALASPLKKAKTMAFKVTQLIEKTTIDEITRTMNHLMTY